MLRQIFRFPSSLSLHQMTELYGGGPGTSNHGSIPSLFAITSGHYRNVLSLPRKSPTWLIVTSRKAIRRKSPQSTGIVLTLRALSFLENPHRVLGIFDRKS